MQAQLAQVQANQLSTAAGVKVKLKQLFTQSYHDSVEASLIGQPAVDAAYARYEVFFWW